MAGVGRERASASPSFRPDLRAAAGATLGAVVLTLSGCGSAGDSGAQGPVPHVDSGVVYRPGANPPTATVAHGHVLAVTRRRSGRILIDGDGRSLYMSTADRYDRSRCFGRCAQVWRPLIIAHGNPTQSTTVDGRRVGLTFRDPGVYQVTYFNHPLYVFTGDRRRGQRRGQGRRSFAGRWELVSVRGRPIP